MGVSGLFSAALFQTKLALYTSYVDRRPNRQGRGARRVFWDTCDPTTTSGWIRGAITTW